MQVSGYQNLESQKSISRITKWIPYLLSFSHICISAAHRSSDRVRTVFSVRWLLEELERWSLFIDRSDTAVFWFDAEWLSGQLVDLCCPSGLELFLDSSVWFGELDQLVHQKEPVQNNDSFVNQTSLRTICLRLWIKGNNVVNMFMFLAQTNCFISWDLLIYCQEPLVLM